MRELLTMEETLRKCSLQLPVDPDLLEEPEACKDLEECAMMTPRREGNEESNVLRSQEKRNKSFDNSGTGVEKRISLSCAESDNAPSNCSTNSIRKNLDVTEYSKLPLNDYSVSNQNNFRTQELHNLDKINNENEDKRTRIACTSLDNMCESFETINAEESGSLIVVAEEVVCENINAEESGSLIVIAEEVVCDNGNEDVNKVHEVNEFHSKSEGKLEGIENSYGYLAEGVSNFVNENAEEQCSVINENSQQNGIVISISSEEDQDNNSPMKNNSSVMQEEEKTRNHIQYLLGNLPTLAKYFDIHSKIGVGTFSCVFLASLKEDITKRFPNMKDRKFAVKHLVPTLLPRRIARELKYMIQIGGRENVVGVDLSIRNGHNVVFVMPYLAHKKFSEYVLDMDVEESRDYMRNLMIALKRVHSFNVIHRDIKPSNFLYNRKTKRYLLVDFGLSQNVHPQAKLTTDVGVRKRKRQEENCSENMRNVSQPSCKTSTTDVKRIILQPRRKEGNVIQAGNGASQPVKRIKLSDSCTRGQRMIEHLNQQKMMSENKRTPLTPKILNRQNISVSQNFKPLHSSSKIDDKDISIKKKLFPPNNENELPRMRVSSVKGESPVRSNLSSSFGLRKPMHQNTLMTKSSPVMHPSNLENATTPLMSSQQSDLSKQKFQTLVPKCSKDGYKSGSTVVRVQNSQVKLQMLKPLSPLESEKQRKLLFSKQRNSLEAEKQRKLLLSKQRNKKPTLHETKCSCKDLPQVCGFCLKKRNIPAARAGTPGFRPPEVLLKYTMQTTAVDMWAAGVIMLCVLSGCYPFFRSPDDISGLAEMATIFGTERIKQVAKSLGRNIVCSNNKPPLDLRKLCERLRRRRKERVNGVADTTNTLPICSLCDNSIEVDKDGCLCLGSEKASTCGEFPPSAYDLLEKLLDLNPVTRISAEEALQHPFLKGE